MKLVYFEEGLCSILTHTQAPHQLPHQTTRVDMHLVQGRVTPLNTICENETDLLSPVLADAHTGSSLASTPADCFERG